MSVIKILHSVNVTKKNQQAESHDCNSESLKFMLG